MKQKEGEVQRVGGGLIKRSGRGDEEGGRRDGKEREREEDGKREGSKEERSLLLPPGNRTLILVWLLTPMKPLLTLS